MIGRENPNNGWSGCTAGGGYLVNGNGKGTGGDGVEKSGFIGSIICNYEDLYFLNAKLKTTNAINARAH